MLIAHKWAKLTQLFLELNGSNLYITKTYKSRTQISKFGKVAPKLLMCLNNPNSSPYTTSITWFDFYV